MQKKIVIVDDDYAIQDVVKLIFERAGYDTVVLPNPKQLYEHQHTDASIIILDRQLGGVDGSEVCKELKQQPQFADTRVLLMSASNDLAACLPDSLADGFIEKPFYSKDLLKKVESLLL